MHPILRNNYRHRALNRGVARIALLSLFLLLCFAPTAAAADQSGILFAAGYWKGFVDHWEKVFQQQSGIGMAIIGVGVVALFIITRGKWHK